MWEVTVFQVTSACQMEPDVEQQPVFLLPVHSFVQRKSEKKKKCQKLNLEKRAESESNIRWCVFFKTQPVKRTELWTRCFVPFLVSAELSILNKHFHVLFWTSLASDLQTKHDDVCFFFFLPNKGQIKKKLLILLSLLLMFLCHYPAIFSFCAGH